MIWKLLALGGLLLFLGALALAGWAMKLLDEADDED